MRPPASSPSQERTTAVRLPAISVAHHDEAEDTADATIATAFLEKEEEEEEPPTPYSMYTSVPASAASSPRTAAHFVFPVSSSAYQVSAAAAPALCLSPNEISRYQQLHFTFSSNCS
jgi:hypothetical protein